MRNIRTDKNEDEIFRNIFNDVCLIEDSKWNNNLLNKILRKYKKSDGKIYRNDELVRMYNSLVSSRKIMPNRIVEERIRLRPTRTNSGVVVVTVLTKPFVCPGRCIYCPNDPLMPKSYISSEPGAQRALQCKFDPYAQVYNRLIALKNIGHNIEKVEIIVLGGTWSVYPKEYQLWFVNECYKALNSMLDNSIEYTSIREDGYEKTSWEDLEKNQLINETAYCRNVGLVFETRPDLILEDEIINMRRLGATKIQMGIQSLSDKVLEANMVGRSVNDTKRAFELLRRAGFKIHGHWMPNLYKSSPKEDIKGYKKLWSKDFSPDELKIYPTSVIKNTQLSELYNNGEYFPYTETELINVLSKSIELTPRYCRLSRIIRDIPSNEIEAGNRRTNLRQIVENELRRKNILLQDIHSREIKGKSIRWDEIELENIVYKTSVSTEYFISYKTKKDDRICGFVRLSIPKKELINKNFIKELNGNVIIREVHVYGKVVGLDNKSAGESQHLGLGKSLVSIAEEITRKNKIKDISVISAIGTRKYYEKLGYSKNGLYMSKSLV